MLCIGDSFKDVMAGGRLRLIHALFIRIENCMRRLTARALKYL